jgi:hypothetical protein
MLPIQSRSLWDARASRTLTVTVGPVQQFPVRQKTRPGQLACAIRPGRLEQLAREVILRELLTASAARRERRPEAERQCRQPAEQPVHRQREQQEHLQPER